MAPPKLFPKVLILPVVLGLIFSTALSPYFASGSNPDSNVSRLTVCVLSLESSGIVTDHLRQWLSNASSKNRALPTFKWVSSADISVEDIEASIDEGDQDVWGSIIVSSTASSNLNTALLAPSTTYNANNAITFMWDEGRNNIVTTPRIGSSVRALLTAFGTSMANTTVDLLLQQGGNALVDVATTQPSLLSKPVGFTEVILHAVTIPVGFNALTIGNILMVVFSFATVTFVFKGVMPSIAHFPPKKRISILLAALLLYPSVVAGCYATIIVGLAGDSFTGGGNGWAQLWALQWLQMLAYTTFFASVAVFLVPEIVPLFMLFVLVYNAIGGWNTDLADVGYRFFWYAPMHHAANIIRFILFGSLKSRVGTGVAVLFAWVIFGLLLLLLALLRRVRLARAQEQKQKQADAGAAEVQLVPVKVESAEADSTPEKIAMEDETVDINVNPASTGRDSPVST